MSLRDLPSVDHLVGLLPETLPRSLRADIARSAVADARSRLLRGEDADAEQLAGERAEAVHRARPTSVINATGVLLHTNLGRAPLHPDAARSAAEAATGYGNLEVDLATGARGRRGGYVTALLTSLTGAEAALAVNNNAGALALTLAACARGRQVPVSRGELIEIGGSYRLPELMAASGAEMVEVGTTNRTRAGDYRRAVTDATALLLKVHPSNYRIAGFTEEAALGELVALGRELDLPVVLDAGSGLVDERVPWLPGPPPGWLAGEPGVVQALEAGADLVLFSGDKLLGGPQAGIAVGDAELVERLRTHPMARALRLDGPTLAALSVTLDHYADGTADQLPFWRMATATAAELEERSRAVIARAGVDAEIRTGASTPGAGSVPGSHLSGPVIAVTGDTDRRYLGLLAHRPPVVARREEGVLMLDLRAVPPDHDDTVADAVAAVG